MRMNPAVQRCHDFKVAGEHRRWSRTVVDRYRQGRGVKPCYLVICHRVPREFGRPPCPGIATRVDARSICFLGAGPTCPTCPTKIRKRERKASLFLPNFLDAIRPRPSTVLRLRSPRRTRWPGWTQPDGPRVLFWSGKDEAVREVDTRRRFHLRVYQERRRAMKSSAAATLFANIAISEGLTAPEAGAASWGVGVYPGCDSAAGFAAGGSSTWALSVCSE
jgi:hypothetical protein